MLHCRPSLQNGKRASARPAWPGHCSEGNSLPEAEGSCKGRHPFASWPAHWQAKGAWHSPSHLCCWQATGVQFERWHAQQRCTAQSQLQNTSSRQEHLPYHMPLLYCEWTELSIRNHFVWCIADTQYRCACLSFVDWHLHVGSLCDQGSKLLGRWKHSQLDCTG